MEFKTEVELGDEVYILLNGKVIKAPVTRIVAVIEKPSHLRDIWETLPYKVSFAYDVNNCGISITRTGKEVYLTRDAVINALVPA